MNNRTKRDYARWNAFARKCDPWAIMDMMRYLEAYGKDRSVYRMSWFKSIKDDLENLFQCSSHTHAGLSAQADSYEDHSIDDSIAN